jgi:tRNA threonylcarbamoyladenosine biosynthesis protein TsaB
MKILALELSTAQGSIAWTGDEAELFSVGFANDRKHSGLFFENLDACIGRFGKPERIVVGLGPGSYAGTRIALAAAIGLRAATRAELIGLPSLCAMATDAEEFAVIGDARRQSFFWARVENRVCIEGPLLCTDQELEHRLRAITCPVLSTETLVQFPQATVTYPAASWLARLASHEHQNVVTGELQPIYLREPHITQPKTPVLFTAKT